MTDRMTGSWSHQLAWLNAAHGMIHRCLTTAPPRGGFVPSGSKGSPGDRTPKLPSAASIAYDYIMSFGGSFGDHIIPGEDARRLAQFSGRFAEAPARWSCREHFLQPGSAWSSSSWLIGAVGSDFDPYAAIFEELGIDLTHVHAGRRPTDRLCIHDGRPARTITSRRSILVRRISRRSSMLSRLAIDCRYAVGRCDLS